MPKRKTADATIETAAAAAEPKKRAGASRARSTSVATPHKRTTVKRAAQPSNVPGNAAIESAATVSAVSAADLVASPEIPVSLPESPASVPSVAIPSHDQIARLAYSYFEQRGYQPGDPREDWLRAERELAKLAQNR